MKSLLDEARIGNPRYRRLPIGVTVSARSLVPIHICTLEVFPTHEPKGGYRKD